MHFLHPNLPEPYLYPFLSIVYNMEGSSNFVLCLAPFDKSSLIFVDQVWYEGLKFFANDLDK